MIPFEEKAANYYEIYITPRGKTREFDGVSELDVQLSKEEFYNMLSTLKSSSNDYKFFQKEYKEYIYNEIIVHNYDNTETRVFKNVPVVCTQDKKTVLVGYHRSKLTFLSVPSTKNIYDINYVKKLIFRVNNRIFINFQCNLNDKNEKTYMIYINYNHEQNIDQVSIETALKKILDTLIN